MTDFLRLFSSYSPPPLLSTSSSLFPSSSLLPWQSHSVGMLCLVGDTSGVSVSLPSPAARWFLGAVASQLSGLSGFNWRNSTRGSCSVCCTTQLIPPLFGWCRSILFTATFWRRSVVTLALWGAALPSWRGAIFFVVFYHQVWVRHAAGHRSCAESLMMSGCCLRCSTSRGPDTGTRRRRQTPLGRCGSNKLSNRNRTQRSGLPVRSSMQ